MQNPKYDSKNGEQLFLTQKISLRPARKKDEEFAKRVHHQAYYDVIKKQFGNWDVQEQDGYFESTWPTYPSEIIVWEDKPCGYWTVEYSPKEIRLHQFLILPEYQGKGIGTELLTYLIDQSTENGLPITLRVFRENRAQTLYTRVGFREVDESKDHIIMRYDPNA